MKLTNRSSEVDSLETWTGLKRGLHQAFEKLPAWRGFKKTIMGLIYRIGCAPLNVGSLLGDGGPGLSYTKREKCKFNLRHTTVWKLYYSKDGF
jgi:hypothetical protein